MLVQQAYKHCKTPEQFKAWSQNLGHESPPTTFTSYGKIDLHREGDLLPRREEFDQEAQLPGSNLTSLSRSGVSKAGLSWLNSSLGCAAESIRC